MAAGGRRRLLPAWMAAAERPAPPPAPLPAAQRRRRQRQAAAPPRAATVYCMNEAELVDVALGALAEKLQHEEVEKAWSGSEEQEIPPTQGNPAGSAVSTEQGSDRSPGLPSPPDAGAERTGWEDSEDDVLKYVREIFFS